MAVDWLSGWGQRSVLTFDHTKVDADLIDIPVLIAPDTSAGIGTRDMTFVFTEIGANWAKMALANASAVETYIEKVDWDNANTESELHGKVTLSSAADTEYGFYYDSAHGDNTTYAKAQGFATSVWDNAFRMVQHMNDKTTSSIEDSTSNSNDGSKKSANEPVEAAGKIWKGQDFDGANDYINCGSSASLALTTSITIEAIINIDTKSGYDIPVDRYSSHNGGRGGYSFTLQNGIIKWSTRSGDTVDDYLDDTALDVDTTYFIALTYDGAYKAIYRGGVLTKSKEFTADMTVAIANCWLGTRAELGAGWNLDGMMDEVRISSIGRSAAWIKATYNSLWDSLITYSAEETPAGGNAPTGTLYGSLVGPMGGLIG